jgi:diguanylate cyclase (GGDEF)-like protein
MASRYLALGVYSLLLALVTGGWLAHGLAGASDFPPPWVIPLLIAACLFVWQFGVPAPRFGLISMERLPQIGMLLVFSPAVAAVICASASLVWPLVNRSYSQGSTKVAWLRALHNPAMTAAMLLIAGHAYEAAGGQHPLVSLALADAWPLLVMALAAQAVNIVLMALFIHLDQRDVRRVLTPVYALSDLLFVPAGVLAAVLYNGAAPATFGLFIVLMVVFVLGFNGIGQSLTSAVTDAAPLAALSHALRSLRGARRIDDLADRILAETHALFRFDEFYLALVDTGKGTLELRVHERHGVRLARRAKRLDEGLFGWVVERAEPVLVEHWERAPEEIRRRAQITSKATGSLIAVPLMADQTVLGMLSVQHTAGGVYSTADLHLMKRLAEQVAPAIADACAFEDLEDYRRRLEERVTERTQALEQASNEKERLIAALRERSRALERESQEDPLTGIANRRRFDQRLAAEMQVSQVLGQPLALAVADMDHFKVVNDSLGHAIGDEVLRQSSALMARLCRANDLVARFGGEEFAIILPGMTHDAAMNFCERLRGAIESHDWRAVHPELRVTLSIGLAHWDGRADADELLQLADMNLYRAKHLGRNRVA